MKTCIKKLRKDRNITLKELSRLTGLTAAHISMIERDKRNPSIQALQNIADALGVDKEVLWWNVAEYVEGKEAEFDLVRVEDRDIYHGVLNDKLTYESVTRDFLDEQRKMTGMLGVIGKLGPGCNTNPISPTVHKVDEVVYMIKGRMICEIENVHIEMKEGDCVVIRKNMAHRFVNNSDDKVEVLMVREGTPYKEARTIRINDSIK